MKSTDPGFPKHSKLLKSNESIQSYSFVPQPPGLGNGFDRRMRGAFKDSAAQRPKILYLVLVNSEKICFNDFWTQKERRYAKIFARLRRTWYNLKQVTSLV